MSDDKQRYAFERIIRIAIAMSFTVAIFFCGLGTAEAETFVYFDNHDSLDDRHGPQIRPTSVNLRYYSAAGLPGSGSNPTVEQISWTSWSTNEAAGSGLIVEKTPTGANLHPVTLSLSAPERCGLLTVFTKATMHDPGGNDQAPLTIQYERLNKCAFFSVMNRWPDDGKWEERSWDYGITGSKFFLSLSKGRRARNDELIVSRLFHVESPAQTKSWTRTKLTLRARKVRCIHPRRCPGSNPKAILTLTKPKWCPSQGVTVYTHLNAWWKDGKRRKSQNWTFERICSA